MGKFVNTIEVMGQAAFTDAFIERTLTEFKDEYVTKIGWNTFASCSLLKFVDLPNVTHIDGQAFMSCGVLETLILRSPLAQNPGASWCIGTAIQNGNGYVYVPSSEITRFSSMAYVPNTVKVRALEDYTVDGTVMGELDPNKI